MEAIKFSEENERIENFIINNIGPAYTPLLLGNNCNKLLTIEKSIQENGGKGALLLFSQENNDLKLMIPERFYEQGKLLIQKEYEKCRIELINKNTVQVPYENTGMILVISPGAIINEILYLGDSLVYELRGLKLYNTPSELYKDLKNTFDFQLMTTKQNADSCNAVIYFTSKSEANKAQEKLLNAPLPGVDGPVSSLNLIGEEKTS